MTKLEFGLTKKQLRVTHGGIIVKRGCVGCGHGLLIFNGTNIGKCVWEDKEYTLTNEYVDKVRSLIS